MDDAAGVERLLVDYCYAADASDAMAVARLFAHDAVFDAGNGLVVSGRGDIVAFFTERLGRYDATAHNLANVRVDVDGATARAQSYVHARLWFRDTDEPAELWARYDDELVNDGREWLFARRRIRAFGWSGYPEPPGRAAPFERL